MGRQVFENGRLLDPEGVEPEANCLLVEGGRIVGRLRQNEARPDDAERIDLAGNGLAPGFIDLHFHGEFVFVAMTDSTQSVVAARESDLAKALARTSEALVRVGTTAYLVTTVAWSADRLARFVARVGSTLAEATCANDSARPLGLHLEGPWINPAAAGAQPAAAIRSYQSSEGEDLFRRAEGSIRMVTLAPEVPGAGELLRTITRAGAVAALGHSLAGEAEIEAAVGDGLRHATHVFNAMGPFHHREPGVAGHVLADDRLSCDLICDGVHVHPAMVKLAARTKRDRLLLITDQIALPALPGGRSSALALGSGAAPVHDDGTAYRLADGRLAGSSLTLDRAARNFADFAGVSELEAVAASTLRPACVLGIENERGTLRAGARADFAVLDALGRVCETWIGGRRVYRADLA